MSCSRKRPPESSTVVSAIATCLSLIGLGACQPRAPVEANELVTGAATATPRAVDILVMVDNSSSMTSMQQKMLAQIPTFIQSLQALPGGLPDVHIAVVSSDLGAPSDQMIGCTQTGDNGNFFSQPQGTCTATTLEAGATFITDDASGASRNFTLAEPAGLATVFECISLLGSSGCGFEHQLASVARALGADGSPAPAGNAGFLRADAELAILMLTNEDDCSAPPSNSPWQVYSLNGDITNDINTFDGPIANYRCNGGPLGGHLCNDPSALNPTVFTQPPLNPPADAVGDPPTLNLTNCESNDTGSSALLPVSSLVAGIKALKSQPGADIVVGAIMAPATPYVVQWFPGQGPSGNQLWPSVEHSCGPASDGSFGDPPVRIAQFIQAFGDNGVTGSICDGSYQAAFELIASKIAIHLPGASSGAGGHDGGCCGGGLGGSTGSAGTTGAGGLLGTGSGGMGTGGGGTRGTGGTPGGGGALGAGGTPGTGGTNGGGAGGHPSVDGGGVDSGGKGSGSGCQTGGSRSSSSWGLTLLGAMFFVRRARRKA